MATTSDEGLSEVDHPHEVYQNEDSKKSGYPPILSPYGMPPPRASELLFVVSMHAEPARTRIAELVQSAMEELSKVGVAGRPLWVPQKDERRESLNDLEYLRHFGEIDETLREIMTLVEVKDTHNYFSDLFDSIPCDNDTTCGTPPKSTMQIEASRDMAYVNIAPIHLVGLLMDVTQWSKAFYDLVSQAKLLGTLSDHGVEGTYDGKVHVMCAEYHLPSPLVPTREYYFARYCKQLPNDTNEMWGVVDVSLEKPFPYLTSYHLQRRPSGCLITGMPNGSSKVIWLEHVEADYSQLNNEFRSLVTTGSAFGATRWLNSLVRHTEFSEIMKAAKTPLHADQGVNIRQAGRKSFLKLADRMMRHYCANVNASVLNPWVQIAPIFGTEEVRVMVKNNVEDPGMPGATNVVFGTSVWLNVSRSRLFNFLRHETGRSKWDLLSHDRNIHTSREFAFMNKGNNPGNRVSLMRTTKGDEEKTEIIYLQESYTDSTSSYVIYTPIDEFALWGLANGMDPDDVKVLPSGFSILPAGDGVNNNNGNGSLLTILFHVIESFNVRPHIPPESLVFIRRLIAATVTFIKDAVLYMNLADARRKIRF